MPPKTDETGWSKTSSNELHKGWGDLRYLVYISIFLSRVIFYFIYIFIEHLGL